MSSQVPVQNPNNDNNNNDNNNNNKISQHMSIRKSKYAMIPVRQAQNLILNEINPSQICYARLNECGNRILSSSINSPINLPQCNTSIMDGYAINYALNYSISTVGNIISIFRVKDIITAGNDDNDNDNDNLIGRGEVVYITTGSALPYNTDCVIKIEDTEIINKNTIKILRKPIAALQHVRLIGSDIKKGQLIFKKGSKLLSSELGILASVGIIMVPVYSKIKVNILSTGDELKDPFTYKHDNNNNNNNNNNIFDSNKIMLMELFNESSLRNLCIVSDGGIIGDNYDLLKNHIIKLLKECDILITSGGVSMGIRDYIKPILEEIGDVKFGRVCIKPGKPVTFGTVMVENNNKELTKKFVFGLPGNPVSSNVCFKMFIDPAIKKYCGFPTEDFNCMLPPISVEITKDIRMDDERPNYNRSIIYWDKFKSKYIAYSTGSQRSSRLLSCKSANCLLRIPQKNGILKKGTMVKALVIGNLIPNMPPDIDDDKDNDNDNDIDDSLMDCGCGKKHHHGTTHKHQPAVTATDNKQTDHHASKSTFNINIGVLTVSDRASKGVYKDESGPMAVTLLKELFGNSSNNIAISKVITNIVPDEVIEIEKYIKLYDNDNKCNLIITNGGTGFSKRDITPEITKKFIQKECNGITYLMYQEGLKHTKFACLSRYYAGITKNNNLIINLPGSVKAVKQCINAIKSILPHAINQLIK